MGECGKLPGLNPKRVNKSMNNKRTIDFLTHLPITRGLLNDKERVFLAVLKGEVKTRSEATKRLKIRSTTISDYVAELLEARLLTEEPSEHVGRGRPSLTLGVNANRVVTIVFQVISQSVHTFMVNLAATIRLWKLFFVIFITTLLPGDLKMQK